MRVADAKGAPPTIPFWLGEAPARSDELSRAVSDLRARRRRLADVGPAARPAARRVAGGAKPASTRRGRAQLRRYLAEGRRVLGAIPTQDTLVLERFFDESGGMQLVLHAPFGSRINKAWCLALRKRFCRQFNFELQAAATEDALLLSLGPQHSFPLADVFRYLHPESTRDVLVQAFLDAPVFKTRWRWNATISLAVPRARGGRRVAPQLQRMLADDLMAAVFPDAAACLENIPGDRQIPDHPLVNQTVRDCLQEAMDFDGLQCRPAAHPSRRAAAARARHARAVGVRARHPQRQALCVPGRCAARGAAGAGGADAAAAASARGVDEPGALDAAAIARVRDEARPDPRDADELHDALMTCGVPDRGEVGRFDPSWTRRLIAAGRAACVTLPSRAPVGRLAPTTGSSSRPNGCRSCRRIHPASPRRRRSPCRPRGRRARGPAPRRSPSWCAAG